MKKYLMMIFISLLFASAVYGEHPEYNEKQVCTDCHSDCSIEDITMTGKKEEKAFVDKAFRQFARIATKEGVKIYQSQKLMTALHAIKIHILV